MKNYLVITLCCDPVCVLGGGQNNIQPHSFLIGGKLLKFEEHEDDLPDLYVKYHYDQCTRCITLGEPTSKCLNCKSSKICTKCLNNY